MPEMVMPPIINVTTEQVINQRPINITSTSQPVPVPVNLPQRPPPQTLSQTLPNERIESRPAQHQETTPQPPNMQHLTPEQLTEYEDRLEQHRLQGEWTRTEDERLLQEQLQKEQDNLETENQFRADVRRQYDPDGYRISKAARNHQSFYDGPRYMQAPKQMQVLPPQHEPIFIPPSKPEPPVALPLVLPQIQPPFIQPAQQQSKSGLRAQSKVGFLNRLRQSSDTDVEEVFPYAASGDLRQEFLISHLQYLRGNQVQISNVVNNEVHNLDCQSRFNKAAVLSMMAKQSGVRAAKLIGLNDCHSITAYGTSQALLYQCQKVTTDISAKKTKCGMEPFVLNSSLSLGGYTLINPFVPCLHGGLFTTVGDQIMECKENAHDWQKAKQTISISHDHLAAMFKMEADSTAMQSLANWHEPSDRSYFDLLGELSAIMENSGIPSLIDTFSDRTANRQTPLQ
ncbi:hypothetical protein RvY_10757 [Ramazzottius varieornatus]|uniref:Uncharacterized protein n=1 Tax=Ramazzottius varieornatus TaxID=947166 RepID=A0A1D1VGA3_RAMVA|nr:hypothetical protein RvY_10757 [Ramazzottius varieornatus]